MRVLVTWGSKRGGTEGIARTVGDALRAQGFEVDLRAPDEAMRARGFDAAIVGGALYAGRWHRAARSFVSRRAKDLRHVPTWFFSSGPLDDSAARAEIPPTPQVSMLMERVGALGHVTFGGRLAPDARGFAAKSMARTHAGDFRDDAQIRRWASDVARALPDARPGTAVEPKGGSLARLVAYGVLGWAACALVMGALLRIASPGVAIALHAIAVPVIFAVIASRYFRLRGARDARDTAVAFVAIVALLDAVVVAGLLLRSFAMFGSVFGTWLPLALIFLVTWASGEAVWMRRAFPNGPPQNPAHA